MNLDRDLQARDFGNRALLALEAGLLDQANEMICRSVQANPQSAATRIIAARVELALHRPAGAVTALDHHDLYAPHQRDLPEVLCLRAQALIQQKQIFKAQQLLQRVVEDVPDSANAHRLLAQCMLATHQKIDGIRHLSRVVELDAEDEVSRRTLATLLEDSDPRKSLQLMQSLPEALQSPQEQLYMARLNQRLEQLCDAEAIYANLIDSDMADSQILMEAGKLADEMGENQRAVMRLEKVTQGGGELVFDAYCELAIVHMHGGRFDKAGLCWWKAARIQRTHARAWAGLLVCSLVSGKATLVGKASDILDQRCNPITRRNLVAELWTHAASGKVISQQTRKDQQKLAVASPLQTMLDYASNILAEHANKFPRRADTFYHLANCRQAMDEKPDAIRSIKQAIRINPNYATAKQLDEKLTAA